MKAVCMLWWLFMELVMGGIMRWIRILSASYRCLSSSRTVYIIPALRCAPGPGLYRGNVPGSNRFKACLTVNPCRRRMCSGGRRCWSCGASSAQMFFCSSCGAIQPPDENRTYFEIFKCDQTFTLDAQKLQRKFVELQRSLHPDNFSQKSPTEQRYSEEQSALVNKAYRTLQKPLTRSVYMLKLRGVELEEGVDASADPALLLQVMEFNEKLAETRSPREVDAMGHEVRATLHDLTEQMNASLNKGDLQSARELLARMNYFTNLEEKVKEKLRDRM